MPDKYMREIEEILRNIERTEPRQDQGERIRPFVRPSARRQSISLPHLEAPVTLILLGILLTLAGGSLAYYQMSFATSTPNNLSLFPSALVFHL